ncbi:MAG: helix-turn-helix transcriptional regulator, partial [Bradyrhizobium sp.]|nr:helix-turn-helix transcriptional regulator [Bradyrhizobium sp.]
PPIDEVIDTTLQRLFYGGGERHTLTAGELAADTVVDPEQLSALIGRIYDAALDADLWPSALEGVAEFVGGTAAMMFWQDSLIAKGQRYNSWGDDPEYTKTYFGKYIALNPLRPVQHLIPVGRVVSLAEIVGRRELLRGTFYDEWMRPQGYVDNVLTNLDRSSTSYATFAVARHERNGFVDALARRKMSLLAPHVRRAVLIGKLGDLRKNETDAWARLIDGIGASIFLVDASEHVVQQNHLASTMLDEADVVALKNRQLVSLDRRLAKDFRDYQSLAALGDARIGVEGIALPLLGKSGRDYVVHFLPLRPAARRPSFDDPRADAAIFIRLAEVDTRSGLQMLARRYHFTPREADVLQAIVEVRGIPQVASVLGISPRTAKAHLQSVFAKTGTDRQADLVRLVAGFADRP